MPKKNNNNKKPNMVPGLFKNYPKIFVTQIGVSTIAPLSDMMHSLVFLLRC